MTTHQKIDARSLALARAVAARIDSDPQHNGLLLARENCVRWYRNSPSPAIAEWIEILQQDWGNVRAALLDESETGQRLRQSNPFCGVLTPQERWGIYREFRSHVDFAQPTTPSSRLMRR